MARDEPVWLRMFPAAREDVEGDGFELADNGGIGKTWITSPAP